MLTLALAACGDKPEPYVEKPVEELYNTGMNSLEDRLYLRAAKQFEDSLIKLQASTNKLKIELANYLVPALNASGDPTAKHSESFGVQMTMKVASCAFVLGGAVVMYLAEAA